MSTDTSPPIEPIVEIMRDEHRVKLKSLALKPGSYAMVITLRMSEEMIYKVLEFMADDGRDFEDTIVRLAQLKLADVEKEKSEVSND